MMEFRTALRGALRQLWRSPGYTVASAGTLALAIAACASVFAAFDAVLVRPLPFARASELALVWRRSTDDPDRRIRIAAPEAAALASESGMVDGLAFVLPATDAVIGSTDGDRHVRVGRITPDLFDVLGVRPAAGRTFRAGPVDAADRQAVLSSEAWQRLYGRDPTVVGRAVQLDGGTIRVVGILPSGFELMMPTGTGVATDIDVWTALGSPLADVRRSDGRVRDQDSDNTGAVILRLRPGVQTATLEQRFNAIVTAADPAANAQSRITVARYRDDITRAARPALAAVLGAVLLVLLVASLNVTGLMVARAAGRQREMAVRSALGATPARILVLLFVETAAIAAVALIAGLTIADWSIGVLRALAPAGITGLAGARLDASVAFACAIAVTLTSVLATTLSAATLAWRGDGGSLRTRGTGGPSRPRLRPALVVGQVAVSLTLLSAAGLLLHSFASLQRVRPGFDPDRLLTFDLAMPASIGGPAQRSRVARRIADRIRELPGVRGVGLIGGLPLGGARFEQPWATGGEMPDPDGDRIANFRVVSSDWFEASGTRLIAGRAFTRDEDLAEENRIVIVDRRIAERISPDGNALDATISLPLDGRIVQARVVGIAENVRFENLAADGLPALYVPYRQEASRQLGFAVRTDDDPAQIQSAIRTLLADATDSGRTPAWNFRPMRSFIQQQTAPTRFALFITAGFAAVAFLLTLLSLYTLIAWFVSERRAEIGVRIALGAAPGRITARFTRDGLALALIGVAIGLAASSLISRLFARLLFDTGRFDPAVHAAAVLVVLGAATLAAGLPARRAARLDPVRVLRPD